MAQLFWSSQIFRIQPFADNLPACMVGVIIVRLCVKV